MTIQTLGDMTIADRISNILADTTQPKVRNAWLAMSPQERETRMHALMAMANAGRSTTVRAPAVSTAVSVTPLKPTRPTPTGLNLSDMTLRQRVDNMLADNSLGGDRQMWLALTPDQQIARMAANLALASGKASPAPVLVAG